MTPSHRLAENLAHLRLASDLTQDQLAELVGMDARNYRSLEAGIRPSLKVETLERLGLLFQLEAWQMIAPLSVLRRAKFKIPKARSRAVRGPRAKWKGIREARQKPRVG